mmetsp:Transcript_17722/g.32186  ORF Transcript_17722/g.32186 Transcript_17722/m.32186 type:complete len:162 (+) Transcript_17722:1085-1570(+)
MSSSGGNDASPDVTVQLDYYTSLQFVALAVNDIYKSKRVGEDSLCDREFGIELVASQSNLQERGSRLAIHHIHTRGCTWFAPAASSTDMNYTSCLSTRDLIYYLTRRGRSCLTETDHEAMATIVLLSIYNYLIMNTHTDNTFDKTNYNRGCPARRGESHYF